MGSERSKLEDARMSEPQLLMSACMNLAMESDCAAAAASET